MAEIRRDLYREGQWRIDNVMSNQTQSVFDWNKTHHHYYSLKGNDDDDDDWQNSSSSSHNTHTSMDNDRNDKEGGKRKYKDKENVMVVVVWVPPSPPLIYRLKSHDVGGSRFVSLAIVLLCSVYLTARSAHTSNGRKWGGWGWGALLALGAGGSSTCHRFH